MATNILVTSAGRRVALVQSLQRALIARGGGLVWGADLNPRSPALQTVDRTFLVPRCSSEQYIPALLALCKREDIQVLIPTIDAEASFIAAHRGAFQDVGTWVHISDPATIAICQDKICTHNWLTENGFPAPKQMTIKEALDSHWSGPLVAKPVKGSASIGVHHVDSRETLISLNLGKDDVLQTIAPGIEHTIDVFVDAQGKCRIAVPRRRLEVRAGEVSKGLTYANKTLESLAAQIVERLPGARGVLNVQIFYEESTDTATVIEINPRYGGGVPLSLEAGAPLIEWTLDMAAGIEPDFSKNSWTNDLLMLRYDAAYFMPNSDFES